MSLIFTSTVFMFVMIENMAKLNGSRNNHCCHQNQGYNFKRDMLLNFLQLIPQEEISSAILTNKVDYEEWIKNTLIIFELKCSMNLISLFRFWEQMQTNVVYNEAENKQSSYKVYNLPHIRNQYWGYSQSAFHKDWDCICRAVIPSGSILELKSCFYFPKKVENNNLQVSQRTAAKN